MKKSLLIGLTTTAVTFGVVSLTGFASAAKSNTATTSLIDKIATKFNLNKADVQAVFETERSERESQRTAEIKTTLDSAVKTGKITQAQADQLIARQSEMRTFRDTLVDMTHEERRTAIKTKKDEFKQWLSDNKIPESIQKNIRSGLGGPGGSSGHSSLKVEE